jgi:peroxiredoxin
MPFTPTAENPMTSSPTIAERVDAMQAAMASQVPAELLDVFARERRFQGAKTPAGRPALGGLMPDGDLLDVSGAPTSLSAVRDGRPAVVVFYRGAWCPYCNLVLRAYLEDLLPDLQARGVALIAISPQKPDGALTMQESNELGYAVLSDPGNQLGGALGILTATGPETEAVVAGQLGLDVAATNADGTGAIPMPTVVLVDSDGAIRWIDVHPDYGTRTEVDDILKQVAQLGN